MEIETFSNFTCLFCYIGKGRLERAKEIVNQKSKLLVVQMFTVQVAVNYKEELA